jgi:hypothetical protein
VVGHLNPRRWVGAVLVSAPASAGVFLLVLNPVAGSLVPVLPLLAGVGAALAVRYSVKYTWLQGTYPAEALGRLSANLYLFTGISATFAAILIGVLSTRISLTALIALDGIGLLAFAALVVLRPRLRRMAF